MTEVVDYWAQPRGHDRSGGMTVRWGRDSNSLEIVGSLTVQETDADPPPRHLATSVPG